MWYALAALAGWGVGYFLRGALTDINRLIDDLDDDAW